MLLTFQDRLRVPWRGGAKQITLDNVAPIALLVGLQLLAAVNFYWSLFVFTMIPLMLLYLKRLLGKILPKSKFFILWFLSSGIYLLFLFEFTVPLLEILPQENVAFIALLSLSFIFLFKTNRRAALGHITTHASNGASGGVDGCKNGNDSQTAVLISDRDDSDDGGSIGSDGGRLACQLCRKYVPPRAYHCKVCASCVQKQDHHNVWLNCCVGKANHRLYLLGCIFTLLTLLLFANLALTAVCHPTPIFTLYGVIVMMPDDCTDIFFQYDIALCFTGSIYALLMAVFIAISILKQLCFISCGITYTEWRRGDHVNRRNCCWNWKAFCLGQ